MRRARSCRFPGKCQVRLTKFLCAQLLTAFGLLVTDSPPPELAAARREAEQGPPPGISARAVTFRPPIVRGGCLLRPESIVGYACAEFSRRLQERERPVSMVFRAYASSLLEAPPRRQRKASRDGNTHGSPSRIARRQGGRKRRSGRARFASPVKRT